MVSVSFKGGTQVKHVQRYRLPIEKELNVFEAYLYQNTICILTIKQFPQCMHCSLTFTMLAGTKLKAACCIHDIMF